MVEHSNLAHEAERQRREAFRQYLALLAKTFVLPIEEAIARDFAAILADSMRQRLVLDPDISQVPTEYQLQTRYGPFIYNSERREGVSPLLPEVARSFVLSKTQGKILERLLIQPGITVMKNDLVDFVNGEGKPLALNVQISYLRKRIGDQNDGQGHFRLIHTIYGGGGIYFGPVNPPLIPPFFCGEWLRP